MEQEFIMITYQAAKKTLMAAGFILANSMASASTIHVFGDSLTDEDSLAAATAGQLPPPFDIPPDPPYTNGRRSNGNVWTDYLREDFTRATITNVAQSGAIAGSFNYQLAPSVNVPIDNFNDITIFGVQSAAGVAPQLLPDVIGLQEQVNRFAGTSAADDIGVIWIGANDFLASTVAPIIRTPIEVVEDIKTAARSLNTKGIQSLVLGNLPDLGKTPVAALSGIQSELTGATLLFNALLANAVVELMNEIPGFQVQLVDVFSAFEQMLANAASLGITNTTDPCIPPGPLRNPADPFLLPVTPYVPTCGDPNNFVFYDLVHPTTVVHREIANVFAPFLATADVPLPGVIWLMLIGLGGMKVVSLRRG